MKTIILAITAITIIGFMVFSFGTAVDSNDSRDTMNHNAQAMMDAIK